MLDRVFKYPGIVVRLRSSLLASSLDALAARLLQRGHSQRGIREYVRAAAHLAYWLEVEQISLSALTEENVASFIQDHLPRCCCPVPSGIPVRKLRCALTHLLIVLRQSGRIPPQPTAPKLPTDILIDAFETYLRSTCGARPSTSIVYIRFVRQFLESKHETGPFHVGAIERRDLVAFIEKKAVRYKPSTAQLAATALRSFLKFLQMRGFCEGWLIEAVPRVPEWTLSRLPKSLTREQLKRLLASFDRTTSIGRRDYAMALCLSQLGLRAREVVQLLLDDIDWRAGTLRIVRNKSRRGNLLPLPPLVGRAIAAYLRRGRPTTNERSVFVRHSPPIGARMHRRTVSTAMYRAFKRAQLDLPSRGAHVLRHTVATLLVQGGATLKEVADLLGHRSLDTTVIYTKVDLPRLAEVALPWPEAHP